MLRCIFERIFTFRFFYDLIIGSIILWFFHCGVKSGEFITRYVKQDIPDLWHHSAKAWDIFIDECKVQFKDDYCLVRDEATKRIKFILRSEK